MSKLIKSIIAGVVSAISLSISAAYLLTMDFTKYPYDFDYNDPNTDSFVNKYMIALNDVRNNPKVEISYDQTELNAILFHANKKVRQDHPCNLEHFYVEINNDKYIFYVELNNQVHRTRIAINTTLSSNDEEFIFHVDSIKTGMLNTWGLLNQIGKLDQIHLQEIFEAAGLAIKVDLAGNTLTYKKEDLKNYLLGIYKTEDLLMGAIDSSNPEYSINKGLSFKTSLEALQSNDKLSDSRAESNHYQFFENVQSIIDNANLLAHNDLVSGRSNELVKAAFADKMSDLRKSYNYTYEPLSYLKDHIQDYPASTYSGSSVNAEVAYIDEDIIDNFLKTSPYLGKFNLLPIYKNHLYAIVDNIYCDLFTNESGDAFMNYTFAIDVHGLKTRAIVETNYQNIANSYKADFKITNVYYGENVINNEFSNALIDMLDKTFTEHQVSNEDARYYSFNKENNVIRFDFDKFINIESTLSDYKDVLYGLDGTRSLIVKNSPLTDNGKLILKFVK